MALLLEIRMHKRFVANLNNCCFPSQNNRHSRKNKFMKPLLIVYTFELAGIK